MRGTGRMGSILNNIAAGHIQPQPFGVAIGVGRSRRGMAGGFYQTDEFGNTEWVEVSDGPDPATMVPDQPISATDAATAAGAGDEDGTDGSVPEGDPSSHEIAPDTGPTSHESATPSRVFNIPTRPTMAQRTPGAIQISAPPQPTTQPVDTNALWAYGNALYRYVATQNAAGQLIYVPRQVNANGSFATDNMTALKPFILPAILVIVGLAMKNR